MVSKFRDGDRVVFLKKGYSGFLKQDEKGWAGPGWYVIFDHEQTLRDSAKVRSISEHNLVHYWELEEVYNSPLYKALHEQ